MAKKTGKWKQDYGYLLGSLLSFFRFFFFFLFDALIVLLLHHEKLETTAIVTRTAFCNRSKNRKRTPKENTYAADKSILTKSTKPNVFQHFFGGWGKRRHKRKLPKRLALDLKVIVQTTSISTVSYIGNITMFLYLFGDDATTTPPCLFVCVS